SARLVSTTMRSAPRRTSGHAYGWVMAILIGPYADRPHRIDDRWGCRDAAAVPDELVPAPPLRGLRAVLPRRPAPPGRTGAPRGGPDQRPPPPRGARRGPRTGGRGPPRSAALLPRRRPVVPLAAHPDGRGAPQPAGARGRPRPLPARRGGGVARGR